MPGGDVPTWQAKMDVLHKHCADVGRNPSDIMTSTHLRYDPANLDALVQTARSFDVAGMDLGIVYLAPPHTPDVLGPLAKALETV